MISRRNFLGARKKQLILVDHNEQGQAVKGVEGADILVIECMALQPEYQRVSGKNMLHCDIGVITNARLDHMDVMGETREEILSCLMEMLPENGLIFTAEDRKSTRLNSSH